LSVEQLDRKKEREDNTYRGIEGWIVKHTGIK